MSDEMRATITIDRIDENGERVVSKIECSAFLLALVPVLDSPNIPENAQLSNCSFMGSREGMVTCFASTMGAGQKMTDVVMDAVVLASHAPPVELSEDGLRALLDPTEG